jgi:hypothetical protein
MMVVMTTAVAVRGEEREEYCSDGRNEMCLG